MYTHAACPDLFSEVSDKIGIVVVGFDSICFVAGQLGGALNQIRTECACGWKYDTESETPWLQLKHHV